MNDYWLSEINNYPEPIIVSYQALKNEKSPYVKIRRLIDCFECFVKFITISALQEYLSSQQRTKYLTGFLTGKFIKPSLGVWVDFIDEIVGHLEENGNYFIRELAIYHGKNYGGQKILKEKIRIPEIRKNPFDFRRVKPALHEFVNIRNWYAHSVVPKEEVCRKHFKQLLRAFNGLISRAAFLKNYKLEILSEEDLKKPYLVREDGARFCLFPMLISENDDFLFYKDAQLYRKRKLSYQSYKETRTTLHEKAFDEFQNIYPLVNIDGSIFILRRVKLSGEIFGREKDLEFVLDNLAVGKFKRLLITGFPGVGKSAFSQYLAENIKENFFCVSTYFDGNDRQTLSLQHLYDSILAGLKNHGLVRKVYPAEYSLHCVREMLTELFHKAARNVENKRRILLIVDGLDEAVAHSAESCIEAIPNDLPECCRIVMFSRPIDYIKNWWLKAEQVQNAPIELLPLNEIAVRSILEDAIPWPLLFKDERIVKRALDASEGNPLYLKHLIEDILEGKVNEILQGLPSGMDKFYQEIFKRLEKTPLALNLASVLAASSEPLTKTELEEIIEDDLRIPQARAQIALDALMEVLRAVPTGDQEYGYHFFHLSVKEHLQKDYSEEIKYAKVKILSWQCNDKKQLSSWLDEIKNDSNNLHAYYSLIPEATKRLASREVLIDMFCSYGYRHKGIFALFRAHSVCKNPIFKVFALEVIKRLFSFDSLLFAERLADLVEIYPDDIDLYRLAVEALIKKNLDPYETSTLIRIVSFRLLNGPRNHTFFQLLKITASLARYSGGTSIFLQIVWNILPFEDLRGSGEIKLVSMLAKKIATNRRSIDLVKQFLKIDKKHIILKGSETDFLLAIKFVKAVLFHPSLWFSAAIVSIKSAIILFKHILNARMAQRSFFICADLFLQAIPLIFTTRDRPALTAEGVKNITLAERFIRRMSHKLALPHGLDIVANIEAEIRGNALLENGFAKTILYCAIVAFFGPHLKLMFNYSARGLEAVAEYTEEDVLLIRDSLRLLLSDTILSSDHEKSLLKMLNSEDAFNNYLAMVTIIIHSVKKFNIGRQILNVMLEENSFEKLKKRKDAAIYRLKYYRQALSIFSYIFRRIEEDEILAAEISDYVIYLLRKLLKELHENSDLCSAFSKGTVFNQGDPFNPLLPLGIYCSGRLSPAEREKKFSEIFLEWITFAKDFDSNTNGRTNLFRRVVFELIPLSYFSPEFSVEQALELLQTDSYAEKRYEILDVLGTINHIVPGCIERVFFQLQQNREIDLDLESILSEILDIKMREAELKDLFSAMRVFAWHECITTVMISHRRLAKEIIKGFEKGLCQGASMFQIITSLAEHLVDYLFAKDIEGDFFKVFEIIE
jgi:hypothetical protein